MKIRHFLLLLVVVMSSLAVGCAPARSNTDYIVSGGRGEVEGEMSGIAFCAVVEIGEGGSRVRVEYLAPASLCGLVLVAEGERCEVFLGNVRYVCDTSEVVGLLRPVTAFLPKEEAKSVQRVGENTVLAFPSGGTLTLSPKGEPLSFFGENITARLVWWQSGNKGEVGS